MLSHKFNLRPSKIFSHSQKKKSTPFTSPFNPFHLALLAGAMLNFPWYISISKLKTSKNLESLWKTSNSGHSRWGQINEHDISSSRPVNLSGIQGSSSRKYQGISFWYETNPKLTHLKPIVTILSSGKNSLDWFEKEKCPEVCEVVLNHSPLFPSYFFRHRHLQNSLKMGEQGQSFWPDQISQHQAMGSISFNISWLTNGTHWQSWKQLKTNLHDINIHQSSKAERLVSFAWFASPHLENPPTDPAVCQNLVPLVNIKIAGKWMFIPLKMVLIGIDPYPSNIHQHPAYRSRGLGRSSAGRWSQRSGNSWKADTHSECPRNGKRCGGCLRCERIKMQQKLVRVWCGKAIPSRVF